MSQMFFTELHLKRARRYFREQLGRIDKVVFPQGGASLMDEALTPNQAENAIIRALESRLHKGTVRGNLIAYLLAYCPGYTRSELEDLKTERELFAKIAENRDIIKRNIEEMER